jgi:hypothetical protein
VRRIPQPGEATANPLGGIHVHQPKWEVETANEREFSKSSIYQQHHPVDE